MNEQIEERLLALASASGAGQVRVKRPIAAVVGTGRGVPAARDDESRLCRDRYRDVPRVDRRAHQESSSAASRATVRRTCSMAADAARKAMERADVHPGQLDTIILSTATPDRLLPSTAVDLQAELGAARAAAFDIGAACSGWLYAMTVAEGMITSGAAETVLVVGSEKMSAIVDWKDRATCVLFGDGAGAAILQRAKNREGNSLGVTCGVTASWLISSTVRGRRDESVLAAGSRRAHALREDGRPRSVQACREVDVRRR